MTVPVLGGSDVDISIPILSQELPSTWERGSQPWTLLPLATSYGTASARFQTPFRAGYPVPTRGVNAELLSETSKLLTSVSPAVLGAPTPSPPS